MEKVTRIYLVRHGLVEGHERIPVYGHRDIGLSELGRCQMEYIGERLKYAEINGVFSSDLKRGVDSAKIIARFHNVRVTPMRELRELYLGEWEGLTLSELRENYPRELEERQSDILNFRPPGGGETLLELFGRVKGCMERILKESEGKNIVIVGHGGVNRAILTLFLGMKWEELYKIQQDYGCLNIIELHERGPIIKLINGR
ncbi:MAG: histidine phosphatase family protein [Desulfatiglandales bacterium]